MADWNTCSTSLLSRLVLPKSPALNQRKGAQSPARYLRWPAVTILMELMAPAVSEPLVGVAMYTAEPGAPMPSEVAEGRPIWI